jgi:hypothetical protein
MDNVEIEMEHLKAIIHKQNSIIITEDQRNERCKKH